MIYIVFDLDDTIVPSTQGYALAYKAIGIDPQSQDFLDARRCVKDRLPLGHTSFRNRWLYVKQFLEYKNQFLSKNLIPLLIEYERVLADFLQAEWVRLQREALFELCILTNKNTRQQLLKIQAIDPGNRFSHTPTEIFFVGDDVEIDLKPVHLLGWKTILNCEFTKPQIQGIQTFYKSINKLDDLVGLIS